MPRNWCRDARGGIGNGFYQLVVKLRSVPGEVMVFATSERGEALMVAKRIAEALDGHGSNGRSVETCVTDRTVHSRCTIPG